MHRGYRCPNTSGNAPIPSIYIEDVAGDVFSDVVLVADKSQSNESRRCHFHFRFRLGQIFGIKCSIFKIPPREQTTEPTLSSFARSLNSINVPIICTAVEQYQRSHRASASRDLAHQRRRSVQQTRANRNIQRSPPSCRKHPPTSMPKRRRTTMRLRSSSQ